MWEQVFADPFNFALLALLIVLSLSPFRKNPDSYRGAAILSMAAYLVLRDLTIPVQTKFVTLFAFYLGLDRIICGLSRPKD
jgi:hypothetical protein